MNQSIQYRPCSVDYAIWRMGRWGIPILCLYLTGVRPPHQMGGLTNLSVTVIFIFLAFPEIFRITWKNKYNTAIITLICDTGWAVVVCLVVGSDGWLLFFLLIALSADIMNRSLLLTVLGIGIGTNAGLFFMGDRMGMAFPNMMIGNLALIISGAVSIAFSRHLKTLSLQNNDMQAKLNTRSDHYLMRAHEIRTPLTLIQASVELVLDGAPGALTGKQREFLEDIEENSRYIEVLTESMLTRGKLESGVFEPAFETVDLRDVIRPVVADLRTLAERRKQEIRTYYPQILPNIQGDPILLRQTFTNLVFNAIRHTSHEARIVVTVAVNDLGLTVSVTDDGAGMSAEQRRQLFQRFTTDGKGTGLGLLIVKQSVELHGGKIYIDTSLGRGTTFFLTFPFDAGNGEINHGQ